MIRNSKTFILGLAMMVSFICLFAYILSPSFGNGRNGLQYSDDLFNSLSKGSAYFIKEESIKAEQQVGSSIDVSIKASDTAEAQKWGKIFSTADSSVIVDNDKVTIKGDLGKIMKETLNDSDALYNNDGKKIKDKYGYEAREVMYGWYNAYKKIDKELKTQGKFKESNAIGTLSKKVIEPAYNYYGIEIKYVRNNIAIVTFMLIFYVIYTLWYGFAIYYLYDGLGITMTKAAKKSEA
ncbi:MAG: hypothetical protein JL50_18700 [Peptococcaceae bacterium BICA1-7]|nr:MAG: hypothetical protein JL50_18700 [Peptococcaceae bacterium BICA1-7]HBV99034.1 hypothetical protein [Desulfotomaculum sp.]